MGFRTSKEETSEFIATFEKAVYLFATDYIKRIFRDINTNLLRKFSSLFKKDDKGKNREWNKLEEEHIRTIYEQSRVEMEKIISEFKYIKISKT